MKRQLSSKMSPKAKQALLSKPGDSVVLSLLQVSPAANREVLREDLESAGARIRSWLEEPGLVSVEVPAAKLSALAELKGVIYIQTAERYSH